VTVADGRAGKLIDCRARTVSARARQRETSGLVWSTKYTERRLYSIRKNSERRVTRDYGSFIHRDARFAGELVKLKSRVRGIARFLSQVRGREGAEGRQSGRVAGIAKNNRFSIRTLFKFSIIWRRSNPCRVCARTHVCNRVKLKSNLLQ